jgi:ABC-type ATPase involved in cell division
VVPQPLVPQCVVSERGQDLGAQRLFRSVDNAEVGADVQFGRGDQQGDHRRAGGERSGVAQAAQFLEQVSALAAEHAGQRRRIARVRGGHHLEEEVVPVAASVAARLAQPAVEFRAPGRSLLAAVGLAGREQSLPARMSGGEQQRVAIARALINSPALLLADEPTGNLDSQNAGDILALLARLRDDHAMTIVLASHDPQIAARCERLIRLRDGAIVDDIELSESYPPEDMIRRVGQLG